MVTVKNTGVPIADADANTCVVNFSPDSDGMVRKFQVAGPKMVTAVLCDAMETCSCDSDLGKTDNNVRAKGALLLLIVKLMSCILPAVIWIREAFVDEDVDGLGNDEDGYWAG
jgi:hypothetical protein